MSTEQAMVLGLERVRYSRKPLPMRPSAKYHVLLTGPGGGLDGGVAVGDGTVVAVGDGGVGVGVGRPDCTISPNLLANSSEKKTVLLLSTARPS